MTCMHSDRGTGKCQIAWDDDANEGDTENYPIDEKGYCWCEDDPYPGDSCDSFSTGWNNCSRCGSDDEDCECDEND